MGQLKVRPILERRPVTAPLNWNIELTSCLLHCGCQLTIQRPIPTYLATHQSCQIYGVASKVATFKRPGSPSFHQFLLPGRCSQSLCDYEVDLSQLDSSTYHLEKVLVDSLHPVQGPLA